MTGSAVNTSLGTPTVSITYVPVGQVVFTNTTTPTEQITQLISGHIGSFSTGTVSTSVLFTRTLTGQESQTLLGGPTEFVSYTLSGNAINTTTGIVTLPSQWYPSDSNLGVYEVYDTLNFTITYGTGNTLYPVTIIPSANVIYSNSLSNTIMTEAMTLPDTVLIEDNRTLANIKGYFDPSPFNHKYIQYTKNDTYDVKTIDGQVHSNIWMELDNNISEVFKVINFQADPREYITFEVTATIGSDTKVYNITVNHPDYSIDRDIFVTYVN